MASSLLLQQQHTRKNVTLILLSLLLLPLSTLILCCAELSSCIRQPAALRRRAAAQRTPGFVPLTVLVTGVGMSKGLVLARAFYEAGHRVIGADADALACGRVSRALARYYTLRKPAASAAADGRSGAEVYVADLVSLIEREQVDLWCSCSSVASVVEDAEAKEVIERRTKCRAVQFDVPTTRKLHEKHSFIANTEGIGLTVPETHTITSREDVDGALRRAPRGRTYIMKPIGMDDVNRGDMSLLPKNTHKATDAYLSRLRISSEAPWILQQYIKGPEYCTHALVVKGQVKVFASCRSAELLMHYVPLPFESKLNQAMLRFTKRYAIKEGKDFTGHLSFDFMIEESRMDGRDSIAQGQDVVLYPIECNPRAHTAVVLFNDTPGMAAAYMSLVEQRSSKNGATSDANRTIVTPQRRDKYYWIGHDLVELVLTPLLNVVSGASHTNVTQILGGIATFVLHILFWRDGTFERWDAVTWWWLYHVYWPMQFFQSWRTGKKWSRINVSTTKMFESE